MKDNFADVLKKNHLSVTESRKAILRLFHQHTAGALKHSDIEKSLDQIDRVTIYRTLQAFTEKGIIHSIPGSDGAARYALCRNGCDEDHHHDDHVHFVCKACGSTQCLEDVHIPFVKLPGGFEVSQVEMVITGYCNKCKQ
ncbi:MAG TPA: transcriptional repressor [Phnomibacter sp.]|nr:transcriptional repressor [Phnomibacter sp.]